MHLEIYKRPILKGLLQLPVNVVNIFILFIREAILIFSSSEPYLIKTTKQLI